MSGKKTESNFMPNYCHNKNNTDKVDFLLATRRLFFFINAVLLKFKCSVSSNFQYV